MTIAFERQNMCRDTVQKPAIMADDHGTAGKCHQRIFKRAERIDIKIIGRFVKEQQIGPRLQHLGQMNAVTLPTGKQTNFLLLIPTFKVERTNIGPAGGCLFAQLNHIRPA